MLSSLYDTVLKYFIAFLLGALTLFLIMQKGCDVPFIDRSGKVDTFKEVKWKQWKIPGSFWDYNPKIDTQWQSYPVYIDSSSVDTNAILSLVDTSAILKNYFKHKRYTGQFSDSNLELSWRADVYQNNLDTIGFEYNVTGRQKTVTNTVKEGPGVQLVPGITAGYQYFEPNLEIIDRSGWKYGAGYEVNSENFKEGFRIHLGKSF